MHNNADQGRKQMTNDQLIKESERINRDEYGLWGEFLKHQTGVVWTVEQSIDERTESDNPLELFDPVLKVYEVWKDDIKDRAYSHDLSVGFDATEEIRIVRENLL